MPKINSVTYNSIASDTLGVYVTGSGAYDAAELDIKAYEIPGKNGDILISNNRWKNIEVVYPAFVVGMSSRIQSIRNWLTGAQGYTTISDTFDTTHFREGISSGRQSFEAQPTIDGANFELVFNCKPQRYLTSGDSYQSVTNNMTLTNPTSFNALPVFYMVGGWSNGATFTVTNSLGTFTMTATAAYAYTSYISCEYKNVYRSGTNLNDKMGGDFPVLAPGTNTITISGFNQPWIRPRWWEL